MVRKISGKWGIIDTDSGKTTGLSKAYEAVFEADCAKRLSKGQTVCDCDYYNVDISDETKIIRSSGIIHPVRNGQSEEAINF